MALPQQPAATAATTRTSAASSLLRELVEVVALAVILYFGISFAVQAVHVEGLSMFATLDDNDYLIANKIDYRLHAPQRGDIIILRPPSDNSKDFIKRIIALPGERILISDGFVYIQDTAILWGSSWTQGAIWGGGKGSATGVSLTPVPQAITYGSGAIWGGTGGAKSTLDNPAVAGSGAIWGGGRSSLDSTSGTVTDDGAIWGGDPGNRK